MYFNIYIFFVCLHLYYYFHIWNFSCFILSSSPPCVFILITLLSFDYHITHTKLIWSLKSLKTHVMHQMINHINRIKCMKLLAWSTGKYVWLSPKWCWVLVSLETTSKIKWCLLGSMYTNAYTRTRLHNGGEEG